MVISLNGRRTWGWTTTTGGGGWATTTGGWVGTWNLCMFPNSADFLVEKSKKNHFFQSMKFWYKYMEKLHKLEIQFPNRFSKKICRSTQPDKKSYRFWYESIEKSIDFGIFFAIFCRLFSDIYIKNSIIFWKYILQVHIFNFFFFFLLFLKDWKILRHKNKF